MKNIRIWNSHRNPIPLFKHMYKLLLRYNTETEQTKNYHKMDAKF